MPPDPLNGLKFTLELSLGLEKSGKSQEISYCLESGNPANVFFLTFVPEFCNCEGVFLTFF